MPVKLTSEASADDLQERALLAKRQRIKRRGCRAHRYVGVLVGAVRAAPPTKRSFPRRKEETPDRVGDLGFRIGA